MTLFWHTYVFSYLGIGLIFLLIAIQYTRLANNCILETDDTVTFSTACTLLWPVFSCAMFYDFCKSYLSHIMAVSLKDIPHAWKAAVENERNKNSISDREESTIQTVQRDEIFDLRSEIIRLERENVKVLREIRTIKESVSGSGQQRSMKRLANIVRT